MTEIMGLWSNVSLLWGSFKVWGPLPNTLIHSTIQEAVC